MKPGKLLSVISKQYLQMNKVNRYRMTKFEDMSDSELIRACHCYCEENNLSDQRKEHLNFLIRRRQRGFCLFFFYAKQ